MFHTMRRHPFAVEAFFRRSLVLAYAVPKASLEPLVGPGLEVDTYDDTWGFLAIALVETEGLRPKGFPKALGRDFFLSGYRIFTRFNQAGKPSLRGLKILRSDTNKRSMVLAGNFFTHYGYALADVRVVHTMAALELDVRSRQGDANLHVVADLEAAAGLPESSPFKSMEDARMFAGPLPYTFDYEKETNSMIVVKGLRQAWNPRPVQVKVHAASFLEQPSFVDAKLANAFYVHDIPYAWKPGSLKPLS